MAFELKKGEVLFNQVDKYHSFYPAVSGLIKLFHHSASGQGKVIEFERAVNTFAEALMLKEQSIYPVTAKAMQPSLLFRINAQRF